MNRLTRCWSRCRPTSATLRAGLLVEELENRALPSGTPLAPGFQPLAATGTNVTLDHAQDLQILNPGGPLAVFGTIGNGPAAAADVAFYRFTLAQAARVHLETLDVPQGRHLDATLSLYNTDPTSPDPNAPDQIIDTQDNLGFHLLAQNDGAGNQGFAAVDRTLGAGTYYVAVSGSGNDYFNPFLVGSGYQGGTGAYVVQLTASDAGVGPNDGPAVLAASAAGSDGALLAGVPLTRDILPPAPGTPPSSDSTAVPQLSASPLLLRVELSASVDPNSLAADADVVLFYSPTPDFTDPAAAQVFGIQTTFIDAPGAVKELQVTPPGPLAPGYYQLVVQGNAAANPLVVTSLDGSTLLGQNADNPDGQDYAFTFHVAGNEGVVTSATASADDTPATARDLGSIAGAGRQQVTGAIGNDSTDPNGFNNNAVELFHFRVEGTGTFAFAAEVFAQRIGSPLNPSLSLFRPRASDGQLEFVAANSDTTNGATGSDGARLLQNDAALFAGLTAGDYYLAVSSGKNVPDPAGGHPQGAGVFDPNVSHNGGHGDSTGPYVLNLQVEPALYPPHVVATSVNQGTALNAPPTTLTVRFDRPVNVQQLAFASHLQSGTEELASVFVVAADGSRTNPYFVSYSPSNNEATFGMMGALTNGAYALHLAGAAGLADLAGNPLVGNNPSGDYVVPFSVNGPTRGTPGHPTAWVSQTTGTTPQVLGPLFPDELVSGVSITRVGGSVAGNAANYQIALLAPEYYNFSVARFTGQAPTLTLFADEISLSLKPKWDGSSEIFLQPGTYVLGVTWAAGVAPETYELDLSTRIVHETATPLTSGPTPALGLRLVGDLPPLADPPPAPPVVFIPPPVGAAPTLPLVVPPPAPLDPVVVAPSAAAPAPPPATGGGTTFVTVSLPTHAPNLGPDAHAISPTAQPFFAASVPTPTGQGSAVVSINNPANASGIPPQLAQALSDGLLGGVRGRDATTGTPTDSGTPVVNASPLLTAVAAIMVPSPVLAGGGDFTQVAVVTAAEDFVPVFQTGSAISTSELPLYAARDGVWLINQPGPIADAVTRGGVEAVEVFGRLWGSLPKPAESLDRPEGVAEVGPPLSPPSQGGAGGVPAALVAEETPAAVVPWTESLANRPFWWTATTVLSFGWGALNGHKWLVARRGRRLSLRDGDPHELTNSYATSFGH